MALVECTECKKQINDKAENCPHCGAQIKAHTVSKQKKWHERTSVTLCVAAGLIVVAFGFIHIITGVVSPYELPFDIALKESFGYRETFVNAIKIKALPYNAARIKYPLGCKVLQMRDYIESGGVFETRMNGRLRENLTKWQAEFDRALNKPQQPWQEQLQGQIEVIEMNPNDPNTYNNRGIISAKNGEYETAIAQFTRAFQRNPAFGEAYYNRGLVDVAIGQLGQAVLDFTKVVEIKPKFIEGYINRGRIYIAMSQYDQAISDFTKIIEIDPTSGESYFSRSLACYAKGEYDNAWEDVNKIRSLGLPVPPGFLTLLRQASEREK